MFYVRKTKEFNFQTILEKPDNYKFDPSNINNIHDLHPLVKTIHNFCMDNNIYSSQAIVSLSGGVDSMVLLAVLIHLQKKYNFRIYTASIDYGLREESKHESEFLYRYTRMYNIKCYISYIHNVTRKKENSTKRSEFEETSKNTRFDTYKQIIIENNLSNNCGIFVAHHKDDIIENIFTNSMKGGNLLDLEVMKENSTIRGIKIFRPLLHFHKNIIYDFAHEFNIPYFLDTTPKWSRRGKMRNEIFPLLDSVFETDWRNKFKSLGTQSNEWRDYIEKYILIPWFEEIIFENNQIIIPIKYQPKLIYSNIIMKSLHNTGQKMLKKSSIDKIMDLVNSNTNKNISLDGHRFAKVNNGNLIIYQ
jgi:tRNA(Ile)-lysidine synthetase-like protein